MRLGLAALPIVIAGWTLFADTTRGQDQAKPTPAQAPPSVDGAVSKWSLTVQRFGDDELLIFEIAKTDSGYSAQTIDAQAPLVDPKIVDPRHDGKTLAFVIASEGGKHPFSGVIGPDGKARGSIRLANVVMPAVAAKTDHVKTNPLDHKRMMTLRTANREPDAVKRVEALRELLKDDPHHPANGDILRSILSIAEKAKIKAEDASKLWEEWQADAAPYGEAWLALAREEAAQALRGQKPYAELALGIAQKASDTLPPDASAQRRAEALAVLADAATTAGKADLAKSLQQRRDEAEAALDKEFQASFPPFERKPATRPDPTKDAVVLIEAFTNSENTAAAAIEAALAGLAESYKPTDVIVIEHHLHNPSADPLASPDSIARAKALNVRITPTVFLNGKPAAVDGGAPRYSERAYRELGALVEKELKGTKKGSIEASAARTGDEIQIKVDAKADPTQTSLPNLKLRLALTENAVKFVSGNGLRVHRRIVRSMPGGIDGAALKDGQAQFTATIKVSDLKAAIHKTLGEDHTAASYKRGMAPVELSGLTLIAFLQNDADKTVSHAVAVPVGP